MTKKNNSANHEGLSDDHDDHDDTFHFTDPERHSIAASASLIGQASRKHAHWMDDLKNPITDSTNSENDILDSFHKHSQSSSHLQSYGNLNRSFSSQSQTQSSVLHYVEPGTNHHFFLGDKTLTSTHNTQTLPTTTSSRDDHRQPHVPPIMTSEPTFSTDTWTGQLLIQLSHTFNRRQESRRSPATFAGFLSLLILTMSNYMLGPMRDAAALKVGVSYIPMLTLVSTILALASSVPVGWLFEAPNPERKGRKWRGRIGLTRGETQGTSLALFLRCFAVCLFGYAFSFKLMDLMRLGSGGGGGGQQDSSENNVEQYHEDRNLNQNGPAVAFLMDELYQLLIWNDNETLTAYVMKMVSFVLSKFGKAFYVMFFLVVHLMKLHSISLMWGVTSEAMEYEEQAEIRARKRERQQFGTVGGSHTTTGTMEMETEKASGEQSVNGGSSKVGGKSRSVLLHECCLFLFISCLLR